MSNLWGRAAVRVMLWSLLAASLANALVQPVQAGSADAPEVADPSGDVVTAAGAPACGPTGCAGAPQFVDLILGWVANETATDVTLWIDVAGNANANVYGSAQFDVHFSVGGTDYVAGFHVNQANLQAGLPGDGAVTPTGVATSAAYADAAMMVVVPKSAIGNPAAGATMTKISLTSSLSVFDLQDSFDDEAGPGSDYTFTGGVTGGTGGLPGDSDGDGLNDTCEIKYFGNVTAQNATGDPDGDGLTNGQECALGTDPTKADTDGDGTNDKDDPFPLDPSKGGTNSTSTSTSSTNSTSSGSSSRSSTTAASAAGGKTKGAPKDFNEAMDRLTSDPGYLGLSSGGFLAVLVLCIIGLAVRWSL